MPLHIAEPPCLITIWLICAAKLDPRKFRFWPFAFYATERDNFQLLPAYVNRFVRFFMPCKTLVKEMSVIQEYCELNVYLVIV